jgi:flagellar protein FliO/FliZ
VIAFAVIFGVLALLALGLRRLTASRLSMPAHDRGRARQPRLGIVDVYDLDRQRQLILLRRDNVEHLLLIGGPNDLVVETNIVRVPARGAAAGENGFERVEHGSEPPARPVVEPPRGSLDAAASARLGSFAGPGEDLSETQAELAPIGATSPQPARGRIEPVLKPDAVAPAPPRTPSAGPAARPAAAPGPQAPDQSVLSDMAKQLEHALRRPAAPAPSPPASPPPTARPEPAPPQAEASRPAPPPQRRPDVVRPAAPTRPVPPPRAAVAEGAAAHPSPAGDVAAASAPPPPAPAQPVPAPAPAPAAPPMAAPAPPPPAAASPTPPRTGGGDPFSVEEIEAEFARLLGRPVENADNR